MINYNIYNINSHQLMQDSLIVFSLTPLMTNNVQSLIELIKNMYKSKGLRREPIAYLSMFIDISALIGYSCLFVRTLKSFNNSMN
jgi:hypothetical protein